MTSVSKKDNPSTRTSTQNYIQSTQNLRINLSETALCWETNAYLQQTADKHVT